MYTACGYRACVQGMYVHSVCVQAMCVHDVCVQGMGYTCLRLKSKYHGVGGVDVGWRLNEGVLGRR